MTPENAQPIEVESIVRTGDDGRPDPPASVDLPPGILKIKRGYNPNSSSIGTVVYTFPLAFAALSAVLAVAAALIPRGKRGGA